MADQHRRDFLCRSLPSLVALPLGMGIRSQRAIAQQLPRLDPGSEQARALNYVENAGNASDHPAYEAGQRCETCMFFDAQSSGCQLFPQNSVAPGGWCQSWAPA